MNAIKIFIILVITIGAVQTVSAQDNDSGRELKISDDEKIMHVKIFTNLTNSVQTPNSIELSMIIVKLESV